jgi:hypothetical protein
VCHVAAGKARRACGRATNTLCARGRGCVEERRATCQTAAGPRWASGGRPGAWHDTTWLVEREASPPRGRVEQGRRSRDRGAPARQTWRRRVSRTGCCAGRAPGGRKSVENAPARRRGRDDWGGRPEWFTGPPPPPPAPPRKSRALRGLRSRALSIGLTGRRHTTGALATSATEPVRTGPPAALIACCDHCCGTPHRVEPMSREG